MNLFGPKSKVVQLKKFDYKSGVCFLILFVLIDAILLSLTLQKRTMYNFILHLTHLSNTFILYIKNLET